MARARTTIRFGAAHNSVTSTLVGLTATVELGHAERKGGWHRRKIEREETRQLAQQLCDIHGIRDATTLTPKPKRRKRRA